MSQIKDNQGIEDNEHIIFFRESAFRLAELIFNFPNKTFHIRLLEREMEKKTKKKFSTTAIIAAVKNLADFGILTVEETSLTTNVKANLDSKVYCFYKLIFNLYRLNRYLFVDNLVTLFNQPQAIVLFGSYAKGEDIEESDVDILVLSTIAQPRGLPQLTQQMEKTFNRKISIHVLPNLEKSSSEFKNNVANGIVLYGYLKVI